MNCLYFACADCKRYIDAGYRWAYWQLQHPGIVRVGEAVSPSAVLAAGDYWSPPRDEHSDWLLREVLPAVRRFFTEHREHRLLFLQEEHFCREGTGYNGYTEIPTDRCV